MNSVAIQNNFFASVSRRSPIVFSSVKSAAELSAVAFLRPNTIRIAVQLPETTVCIDRCRFCHHRLLSQRGILTARRFNPIWQKQGAARVAGQLLQPCQYEKCFRTWQYCVRAVSCVRKQTKQDLRQLAGTRDVWDFLKLDLNPLLLWKLYKKSNGCVPGFFCQKREPHAHMSAYPDRILKDQGVY